MNVWLAEVRVWLKPSVFDPQGNAVEQALHSLGYEGIGDLRVGKYMSFKVEAASEGEARAKVEQACEAVLCNPVIETYAYELQAAKAGAPA